MLNLVVIYTDELQHSLAFYQSLGLTFIEEQHGNGPVHYAASLGDESNPLVFELYPSSSKFPANSGLRLGVAVTNLQTAWLAALDHHGSIHNEQYAILKDPSGNYVHLSSNVTNR